MNMKFLRVAAVAALSLLAVACSRVESGHVGVLVNLLGSEKGVDSEVIGPGKYWVGWNQELYLFPTFSQNRVWETDPSDPKRAFSFQTDQGMVVSTDIGVTYRIRQEDVAIIFQKYRRGVDEITDVYLKNMIRDALVTEGSKITVERAYGSGKEDLLKAVEERVRNQVGPIGIEIERIYWIGQFSLPPEVIEKINAKIQAGQMTEQRLQEVEQAKAEAAKLREEARGLKEASILRAEGEAEANRIVNESLNDNLIRYRQIEKWDGVLPKVSGNATPMVKLD